MKDIEHTIIFNGKDSYKDLDILVKEYPSIPLNNEEVEEIRVEGRSGSLTIKKGTFKDIHLDFSLSLINVDNFWERIDLIEEWLEKIEDNKLLYDRLDRAYVVKRVEKGNISKEIYVQGEFTVKFICEPFKVPIDEEFEELEGNEFYYTGNVEGEPCIRIYGQGNLQLIINDETITIRNVNEYVEIDSKYLICRDSNGLSKEIDMIGNYPLLIRGENTINLSSNINKVEILPRTSFK